MAETNSCTPKVIRSLSAPSLRQHTTPPLIRRLKHRFQPVHHVTYVDKPAKIIVGFDTEHEHSAFKSDSLMIEISGYVETVPTKV